MLADWSKLSEIKALKTYFETDPQYFQQRVEFHLQNLEGISPEDLDSLALLRVLEITNGCLQWAFRDQHEEALSADRTRECMRQVIGFIKVKRIEMPSGTSVQFTPPIETLIEEGRQLYIDAFKKHIAGADQEYYAYSTAQFMVYGRQRLTIALERIQAEFEALFTPYFIERGRQYVAPYLNALPSEG